jgi:hypothetical protein
MGKINVDQCSREGPSMEMHVEGRVKGETRDSEHTPWKEDGALGKEAEGLGPAQSCLLPQALGCVLGTGIF